MNGFQLDRLASERIWREVIRGTPGWRPAGDLKGKSMDPRLPMVRDDLMDQALQAWRERDGVNGMLGVLCCLPNQSYMDFLILNWELLLDTGKYEEALYEAITSTRTNHHRHSLYALRHFLWLADIDRLRTFGDEIPGPGPWTLYRGVAGIGKARRIRGISWTADFDKAKWFAKRFADLKDPAVYEATVPIEAVCFYTNERNEQEFVCLIPKDLKIHRGWRANDGGG